MSLTKFVKRPAIRDAFKKFGTRERTPVALRNSPLLVPDAKGPRGLAGTAFDYLARFHMARKLRNTNVRVHEGKWVAERAAERLEWGVCRSPSDKRYWRKVLTDARAEVTDNISGKGDLRRLADLCQCLGHADILMRRPDAFDPTLRPAPEVSEEILNLLGLFDKIDRFRPHQLCIMNPTFSAQDQVGGADADLVIDDRLIDLKTTENLGVSLDNLLQLAGYAALQQMGGIALGDHVCQLPFASVELYFARYGQLMRWTLEELFPSDGFEYFCDAFRAETEAADEIVHEASREVLGKVPQEDTDVVMAFIASNLERLQRLEKSPTGKRQRGAGKAVPVFTVSGVDKKHVARYRRLAKKFDCMLLTQPNGDLIFVRLSQGTGAFRK